MLTHLQRTLAVVPFMLVGGASASLAASSPLGVWMDHTGRGAVEITDCSGALCGRVVWLKDAADADGCNVQIIGNVKPVAGGKWDGGWIWDPERKAKFDVELAPIDDQKLRVHGYAGLKLFGETMTWTRAPADLKMCTKSESVQAETTTQPQAETSAPGQQASAPEQKAEPAPSNAPAAVPPGTSVDRSDAPSDRGIAGLPLKFSERQKGKEKVCTVSVMDFGKFSFPC